MLQTKIVQKIRKNTYYIPQLYFFETRTVYGKEWKNIVQPAGPHMTTRRMRISCWIPMATNAHSEYVILIAFPRQQWSQERASMSR